MTSPLPSFGPPAKRLRLDLGEAGIRPPTSPVSKIAEEVLASQASASSSIAPGRVVAISVKMALDHLDTWLSDEEDSSSFSQEEMDLARISLLQALNQPYSLPELDDDVFSLLHKTEKSADSSSVSWRLSKILTFIREITKFASTEIFSNPQENDWEKGVLLRRGIEEGGWLYNTVLALREISTRSDISGLVDQLEALDEEEREEMCSFALELLQLAPYTEAGYLLETLEVIWKLSSTEREEICSFALELLHVASRSDAAHLMRELAETDAEERKETGPLALKLLKVASHSEGGSLVVQLEELLEKEEKQREEICFFAFQLLAAAPYTEAAYFISKLCYLDPEKREDICRIALELLKIAPHSDAGSLLNELEEVYSNGEDSEEIEEFFLFAKEQLKLASNVDASRLFSALRSVSSDRRKEIHAFVLQLLKAASNVNLSRIIDKLAFFSSLPKLPKFSFVVLELLKAIPEADPHVLIDRFIRTFPEETRKSVRILIFKLHGDYPNATIGSILTVIHKTSRDEWEEICPLILRLLEVSPSANVSYLTTRVTKAFRANKGDPEEWKKRCFIVLQLLKTFPHANAGYLIGLLSDIPANEADCFFSLFERIQETFPNSNIDDLVYALYALTHEERKALNKLFYQELPQYPEPSLSFLSQDGAYLVVLFKMSSEKARAPVAIFILEALKSQPDLNVKALKKKIGTLSKEEQETVCSFLTAHLHRNRKIDIFEAINTYKQLQNSEIQLDPSIKKEFLPFLAPAQIRETVQAATEEEIRKAFAKALHLKVSKDEATVVEALKLGIDHGVEAIESGFNEDIYNESDKSSFEEAFRLMTHFLDELDPFTLSLLAVDPELQSLVLRYLPFMQKRHLAVVLPHISLEKLYEELDALKKRGWPEGLLINQVYDGRANQPL